MAKRKLPAFTNEFKAETMRLIRERELRVLQSNIRPWQMIARRGEVAWYGG